MPTFDDVDAAIRRERITALDAIQGPRVGDWIEHADGVFRRISHVWADEGDPQPDDLFQTTNGGSFHLGKGYVSYSGSLYPGVKRSTLTETGAVRFGDVWFFHHDHWTAHNAVNTRIEFRVFKCSEPSGASE